MEYTKEVLQKAKNLKKTFGRVSAPLFQRNFKLDYKRAQDLVDLINKTRVYAK